MKTDKVRIGVNTAYVLDQGALKATISTEYIDALVDAGAIPILFPPLENPAIAASLVGQGLVHGWLFVGGPDINPKHYGGHPQTESELLIPRRDAWDTTLASAVLSDSAPRVPVLGICGGAQLICVARGGKLIQDIQTEWGTCGDPPHTPLPHTHKLRPEVEMESYRHSVHVKQNSKLWKALCEPTTYIQTTSLHHQSVQPQYPGVGMEPVAWAEDGIVEAIELTSDQINGRWVVGVQWHPERQRFDHESKALFRAFVAACEASINR